MAHIFNGKRKNRNSVAVGEGGAKRVIFFALFLYTIENSPMNFSRESQTSTNTSECESEVVTNCTKSTSFVEGLGLMTGTFRLYTEIFRRPLFYNNRDILVLKCVSLLEKLRIF